MYRYSKCFTIAWAILSISNIAHAEEEDPYAGLDIKGSGSGPQIIEPDQRPQFVQPTGADTQATTRAPIRDEESHGLLSVDEVKRLRDGCNPSQVRDPRTKRCISKDSDPALTMAAIARLKCPTLRAEGKDLIDRCAMQLQATHKGAPEFANDENRMGQIRDAFQKIKEKNANNLKGVKRLEPAKKGILFDTHYEGKSYTIERRGNGDFFYRGYSDMSDSDREEARRNVERLNLDLAYEKALQRPDALFLLKIGAPQIVKKGEGLISDTIITRPAYTIEKNRLGIYYVGQSNMSPAARANAERETKRLRAQERLSQRVGEVIAEIRTDDPQLARKIEQEFKPAAAASGANGESTTAGVVVGKITDPGKVVGVELAPDPEMQARAAAAEKAARDKFIAEELAKEEQAKLAREKAAADKVAADKVVADRIAAAEKAAEARIASVRQERENAEAERLAAEKQEREKAEKLAREKAEADRIAQAAAAAKDKREPTEAERIAKLVADAKAGEGSAIRVEGESRDAEIVLDPSGRMAADEQRVMAEAMGVVAPAKKVDVQKAKAARSRSIAGKLSKPELFKLTEKETSAYYDNLGKQRFKGKDNTDDLFIDLSMRARNHTYYDDNGSGELDKRKQAAKHDAVEKLQKNINAVLKQAGVRAKVMEDGMLGKQTQSALDIISKDPELRRMLVELEQKK